MADRQHLDRLARELTDKGRLIEAGWIALRRAAIPLDAPPAQLEEMRTAFFAGAQHLFACALGDLVDRDEVTARDMRRMKLIQAELNRFIETLTRRHMPHADGPGGHA